MLIYHDICWFCSDIGSYGSKHTLQDVENSLKKTGVAIKGNGKVEWNENAKSVKYWFFMSNFWRKNNKSKTKHNIKVI